MDIERYKQLVLPKINEEIITKNVKDAIKNYNYKEQNYKEGFINYNKNLEDNNILGFLNKQNLNQINNLSNLGELIRIIINNKKKNNYKYSILDNLQRLNYNIARLLYKKNNININNITKEKKFTPLIPIDYSIPDVLPDPPRAENNLPTDNILPNNVTNDDPPIIQPGNLESDDNESIIPPSDDDESIIPPSDDDDDDDDLPPPSLGNLPIDYNPPKASELGEFNFPTPTSDNLLNDDGSNKALPPPPPPITGNLLDDDGSNKALPNYELPEDKTKTTELLDVIKKGKKLKPASERILKNTPKKNFLSDDTNKRNNLLSEIKKGKKLKPTSNPTDLIDELNKKSKTTYNPIKENSSFEKKILSIRQRTSYSDSEEEEEKQNFSDEEEDQKVIDEIIKRGLKEDEKRKEQAKKADEKRKKN